MFDRKPEVMSYTSRFYDPARRAVNDAFPGKLHGDVVGFGSDEDAGLEPLQAADLFAYEWRHRVSDLVKDPNKRMRTSYRRIRESRPSTTGNNSA